jgi:hypothetical protein
MKYGVVGNETSLAPPLPFSDLVGLLPLQHSEYSSKEIRDHGDLRHSMRVILSEVPMITTLYLTKSLKYHAWDMVV